MLLIEKLEVKRRIVVAEAQCAYLHRADVAGAEYDDVIGALALILVPNKMDMDVSDHLKGVIGEVTKEFGLTKAEVASVVVDSLRSVTAHYVRDELRERSKDEPE